METNEIVGTDGPCEEERSWVKTVSDSVRDDIVLLNEVTEFHSVALLVREDVPVELDGCNDRVQVLTGSIKV